MGRRGVTILLTAAFLAGCVSPFGDASVSREPDWSDSACGQPGAPQLNGPDVVRYPATHEFKDSECVALPGNDIGDGCSFREPSTDKWDDGSGSYVGISQMATDHKTCESLYEVGVLDGTPAGADEP